MFASSKTASASGGYQISRSLRFNSADSAYLNRTPASASNQKTWTFSAWVKRAAISTTEVTIFGKADTYISINSNSLTANFNNGGANYFMQATAVLRDPSAWYHIVIVLDTTQATAANRASMYVNGVQTTAFQSSTYTNMAQNYDAAVNSAAAHAIGRYSGASPSAYFDGYMTEINFIDGQALSPSYFGQTDPQTGVWSPTVYRGGYGTNGFYLNFLDNSNTTAATLGKDYSGNGNNWTPNNFSVSAGAGNDSLVDSPTNYGIDSGVGGEVRGNYCTLNPLQSSAIVSNGNLLGTATGAGWNPSVATIGVSSGKWYWEILVNSDVSVSGAMHTGIVGVNYPFASGNYIGNTGTSYAYRGDGQKVNNSNITAYGASLGAGSLVGVALDLDAGTITFYKNGTSQGVAFSSITGTYFPATSFNSLSGSINADMNFGQRPFAYTAPSGFKALCTQNLPTPTIGATNATQSGKYFNPVTYTGNATSRSITGVGFQPDWVWIKDRTTTNRNVVFDAVRGANNRLITELDIAEDTGGGFGVVTAFNSDGFSIDTGNNVNQNTDSYVSWNWKANGSGSSNTSGSITATVSASTTSGFSVATYTGTGVAGTIGHGLGVAPSMIIVKSRSASGAWGTYHTSLGNSSNLVLNTTAASASSATIWNATSPTSSVFSVGINTISNTITVTYVAYCFAEIAGYSKFGSYTGNGSTDGPFVFTNMRPAYVMIKRTDTTGDWIVWDSVRNTYNVTNSSLFPNLTQAEATGSAVAIDLLANGFKLRNTDATQNASGGTYIFMALATNPFKYSLAR